MSPAEEFAAALCALYEAAEVSSYALVVRQAGQQKPPVKFTQTSLSDWLLGKSLPADPAAVQFLVEYLGARARHRGKQVEGLSSWTALHGRARKAKQAGRHSRPPGLGRSGGQRLGVPSAYPEQIKGTVPPQLLGREPELAELTAFCLDADRGPYVWWQAEPWAGKSALLSTFVVHPPKHLAGRVWLVSFFITGRLAAQDTREAFTTALLEQLRELTGQDLPLAVDEPVRERHLQSLLRQAAVACQAAGGRLVLVVDGLDEDRSVRMGRPSIAALLPADPPAGMRVIVAGRPNPSVPDDVPDWHPLRGPGTIHALAASSHARDLQRLAQSELKRLLRGTKLEQDLLGLLTAARGGLSGPDLRELTGADLIDIEDVLHTVAGRTFTRRSAVWAPQTGPEVYLLGHEELHKAATYYLGEQQLAECRDQLHAWAHTYCTPHNGRPPWSVTTPEYLLRGYPSMLHEIGDLDRLVALAVDLARHDRMLDLSGGDAAALTEIATAQELLLEGTEPDLLGMARLSIHRHALQARNGKIPGDLPAVWAALGQVPRAEALARSITDPDTQAWALTGVVEAVVEAGNGDLAEQIARTIISPYPRVWALAAIAGAATGAGDAVRGREVAGDAERVARSISHPHRQAWALIAVVRVVAEAGDPERARQLAIHTEQAAYAIRDPYQQATTLTQIAQVTAGAGDAERVRKLATDAEHVARSLADPVEMAWTLTDVAQAATSIDDDDLARRLTSDAEQIARTIVNPDRQARTQYGIVWRVAAAGDPDAAESIARSIAARDWQARALTAVMRAVAETGDRDRARQLAADVEQIVSGINDAEQRAQALAEIGEAAAAAGDYDRAEYLARAAATPDQQAQVFTVLARALAKSGDPDRGRRFAVDAERAARSITDPFQRSWSLLKLAKALTNAGNSDRAQQLVANAEHLASGIVDPDQQAHTLAEIARATATAGDLDRAEHLARGIVQPYARAEALAAVARAVAGTGNCDLAQQLTAAAAHIASTITEPYEQAHAMAEIARAAADGGDLGRAQRLTTDARQAAHTTANPVLKAWALGRLAEVAVSVGDPVMARQFAADAEDIARAIESEHQSRTLAEVASVVAAAGDQDGARQLAADAEHLASTLAEPQRGWALAAVAQVVAATGDPGRAERIARTIPDADTRATALVAAAKETDPLHASHLLAAALAAGSWLISLPELSRLRPQLVIQLVDAMLGDDRSRDTSQS